MALAPHFNPNKPFGECHGDPNFAYEQNGHVYNGQFQAVDSATGKRIVMQQGAPIRPIVPTKKSPEGPKARDIDPEDETEDEKPLDLIAWRDGKLPGTLWPLLVAAIKAQCGRAPSSKVEAMEMINAKWPHEPQDQEADNEASEAA